jgi:hypothetical protein
VTKSIASFVVVALLLAGCSKAVQITQPVSSHLTAPLTTFEVKFSPYFVPGTFNAQLDGVDVTPNFAPAAAAGGTSRMRLPDTPEGLTGGTPNVTDGPPGISPSGVSTGSGTSAGGPRTVKTSPATGGGAGGGGTGTPTPTPTPNIAFFTHQLHVSGQCNGLICATTDDLEFTPIHLAGNPTTLNLRVGQKAQAQGRTKGSSDGGGGSGKLGADTGSSKACHRFRQSRRLRTRHLDHADDSTRWPQRPLCHYRSGELQSDPGP